MHLASAALPVIVPVRPAHSGDSCAGTTGSCRDSAAAARDIGDRRDLDALLAEFYTRACADELLGPIFVGIARMDLAAHLPVIGDFWETVLFGTGKYRRNTFVPHEQLHAAAQLTPADFARWLTLWNATVDERHAGEKAERAKAHGLRIANSMCRRLTGREPLEVTRIAG